MVISEQTTICLDKAQLRKSIQQVPMHQSHDTLRHQQPQLSLKINYE